MTGEITEAIVPQRSIFHKFYNAKVRENQLMLAICVSGQ